MIYELTLTQRYFDQEIVNRWNYLSSGTVIGSSGAYALIKAMGYILGETGFPVDTVASKLAELQPPSVTFVNVMAKAIREAPVDFYDYAYPVGTYGENIASSQPASPTLAYGLKTNRVRTDIARGTKRFVGVLEAAMSNGGLLESGYLTFLNDLSALMGETLSYTESGSTATFQPIVCGKKKYVTPRGNNAYEYWPTIAEQMEHVAQGVVWTPFDTVRTQTSRQYKHGG
jgi:hypothetical protein